MANLEEDENQFLDQLRAEEDQFAAEYKEAQHASGDYTNPDYAEEDFPSTNGLHIGADLAAQGNRFTELAGQDEGDDEDPLVVGDQSSVSGGVWDQQGKMALHRSGVGVGENSNGGGFRGGNGGNNLGGGGGGDIRQALAPPVKEPRGTVGTFLWVLVLVHVLALVYWLSAWWRQKKVKESTMRAAMPPQKVHCSYDFGLPPAAQNLIPTNFLPSSSKPAQA